MHEIRDYVEQARRHPTTEHLEQLWSAVFGLTAWYFLPGSEVPGPSTPMVVDLDGDV